MKDSYKKLEQAIETNWNDTGSESETLIAVCQAMLNMEIEAGLNTSEKQCFSISEELEREVIAVSSKVIAEAQGIVGSL